jgi:hypothetical protein
MPFPLLWKINFLSLVPRLLELKPVMHSIQLVAFLIFEVSLINRTHASPTLNFGQTSEMTIGLLDYSLSLSECGNLHKLLCQSVTVALDRTQPRHRSGREGGSAQTTALISRRRLVTSICLFAPCRLCRLASVLVAVAADASICVDGTRRLDELETLETTEHMGLLILDPNQSPLYTDCWNVTQFGDGIEQDCY